MRSPASFLFWLVLIALVAAVAHLRGFAPSARPQAAPQATGAAVAGRARVIDGDTIDVAGSRIRLFGIDAPETRQSCRSALGRDYACGRLATRALAAAIAGRAVACTPVDHDRYDRDVAICTAGGRDLGDVMVRSGNAVDYARHSQGRYAAAEREAREAKRGIWAGEFEQPEAWRRMHPR